jgi:hypothetical protein
MLDHSRNICKRQQVQQASSWCTCCTLACNFHSTASNLYQWLLLSKPAAMAESRDPLLLLLLLTPPKQCMHVQIHPAAELQQRIPHLSLCRALTADTWGAAAPVPWTCLDPCQVSLQETRRSLQERPATRSNHCRCATAVQAALQEGLQSSRRPRGLATSCTVQPSSLLLNRCHRARGRAPNRCRT